MLYRFIFLQVVVYLFASPLVRVSMGANFSEYHFGIAIIFASFFCISGTVFRPKSNIYLSHSSVIELDTTVSYKWLLIFAWLIACILISLEYELSNRRIGTENAAELFAGIPYYVLFIFRTLEISVAFLTSLVLTNLIDLKKLRIKNILLLCTIGVTLFLLGVSSSRTAVGLFLINILILIQNEFPLKKFKKLIIASGIAAVVVFVAVTASRFNAGINTEMDEYFSSDILQRVDGLEVVSKIIDKYGYQMTGINAAAALNPIISLVPFLDKSTELKTDALTTVKSVILQQEFDSKFRDVNSFVILDAYYCGGLIGVAFIASLIAYLSRMVDAKIGVTSNWIVQIFLVAIVVNFVSMERETIGIFISIIRDWVIMCVVTFVFLSRAKIVKQNKIKEY
jgi:oligosaccharide repeat unit polymerase